MKSLYYKREVADYLKSKAIEIIEEITNDKEMDKLARIDGVFRMIHAVEADVKAEEEAEKAAMDKIIASPEPIVIPTGTYDPSL